MPARPLCWLTVSFILGIAAQRLLEGFPRIPTACFAAAALLLLAGTLLCLKYPERPLSFSAPAVLFALFGLWAAQAAAPPLPFPAPLGPFLDGRATTFVAEVSAPPDYYPGRMRIPLRLVSALRDERNIPVEAGILLTVPRKGHDRPSAFWLPGDRLLLRTGLRPFRSFKNPGGFDYTRYQAEKGFFASAWVGDGRLLVKMAAPDGVFPISIWNRMRGRIDLFRQKALFWLVETIRPDSAALYAAMVLGYQQLLDKRWRDLINRAGLNHLLSVSGLHLGLVSLLVFWLVRRLVRTVCPTVLNRVSDRQIALWPALACAVAYAFLAGFGVPPIWRSVLMLAVCLGAAFWYRYPDSLSVLALAALVILILSPNSLHQISFQFTFACVLAIILVYPRFRKLRLSRLHPALGPGSFSGVIVSHIEDVFWVSVSVNVLIFPLTVFYFNGFSLAGFVANLVLVPCVGFVVLPWGLLSIAVFALNETLAYPFIKIGEWLLSMCLRLIEWFGGFSWSHFWTGSLPLFWLFAIYAGLALLLVPLSRKVRLAGIGFLGVLFCLNAVWDARAGAGNPGLLRVDVIDVGQGSSTLVRFPSGEAMLVDGGGFYDDSFDVGRAVVAPFLWHSGVGRIEHVVLSHDHPDHRNGLRFVLAHFEVGSFWTSGIKDPRGHGENGLPDLDEIAARRNIRIRSLPELWEGIRIGEVRVRVCHPDRDFLESRRERDPNDCSLVVEIEYGDTAVVLPGDIGGEVERSLAPKLGKDRRVLLISPHHGSEGSNSEQFLDALRPRGIVFSCGHGNRFDLPGREVLRRCLERNIPMYRTDLQGAVHAVSDGRNWSITTEEN